MEKALAAVHHALQRDRSSIILEYSADSGNVGLVIDCSENMFDAISGPILANYPQANLEQLAEATNDEATTSTSRTWVAGLRLAPELFPILRHSQFEDMMQRAFADPIDSLLQSLRPEPGLEARVVMLVRAASRRDRLRAIRRIRRLAGGFFRSHERWAHWYAAHVSRGWWAWLARVLGFLAGSDEAGHRQALDVSASRTHEREDDLQAALEKFGGHLFEVAIAIRVTGPIDARKKAHDRLAGIASAFAAFTRSRLATFSLGKIRKQRLGHLTWPVAPAFFSHEELATLFHPPTAGVVTERLQSAPFAQLEAPADLASGREPGAMLIGQVKYRSDQRQFGLNLEDRRRHLYVIGKTGMGKTSLLQSLLEHDISQGLGVCLVDPHGDLADAIIARIPPRRTNDVIILDAGDRERVIGFNPLSCREPRFIDQVTSGVVSAFRKLHDSWGPRLEDTLRNAVFAAVEQNGNLRTLLRLLGEETFRLRFVEGIRDPLVRSFWLDEFAAWDSRYRTEAVAAIQNKIRPFLTNTTMRAIVSQTDRSIDLRQIMDTGRVLIIRLAKGIIGEDNATLLGSFLVTAIQQAALTRADIPEVDRRDFHLVIDEFQSFSTGSFETIMSEARKYRLQMTVAHQYLKQIDENTQNAIFGNCGSFLTFQTGSDDAEKLARLLSKFPDQLKPSDITNLPKYTAYARLLINGLPSNPFTMMTLKPKEVAEDRSAIVREQSMRRAG